MKMLQLHGTKQGMWEEGKIELGSPSPEAQAFTSGIKGESTLIASSVGTSAG